MALSLASTHGEVGCSKRPWLELYMPQHGILASLLASHVSSTHDGDDDDDGGALPNEVWLLIMAQVHVDDCASLGTLGSTCHALRHASRHPSLWEAFCRVAFPPARGFIASDTLLRSYGWSWRRMFLRRPRLRTDGLYYLASKRLIHGLNEGRGMKEADVDYYNPAGNWVVSYRLFRFFPDGAMFIYLCSSHGPADVRKAAAAVTPTQPRSLQQRLRGANWGAYTVRESAERVVPTDDRAPADDSAGSAEATGSRAADEAPPSGARTHIEARTLLYSHDYPNMAPATIRYGLQLQFVPPPPPHEGGSEAAHRLRGRAEHGGGGARLFIREHAIEGDTPGAADERLTVPAFPCGFLPFGGRMPDIEPAQRFVSKRAQ